MNKVHFSSGSEEWETPEAFFKALDDKYHFTLDPACTHENAKCREHYTKAENGLSQNWGGHSVFCNPPYGRGVGEWVRKGYEESTKNGTTVVMLLPARTDTKWFHDYCLKGRVEFIRGRLKFGNSKDNAPFPNMIVIFENGG